MFGKIKLLKIYVFSKLNYVSSLMTVPQNILKKSKRFLLILFGEGETE